eukprot:GHVU01024345.1.p1 GENE.GHVU01024345.1~~GHVU01024345.1.p1  ORF type:complete len:152 (-),score=18.75 GHVU01024345.1:1064-1519(-)
MLNIKMASNKWMLLCVTVILIGLSFVVCEGDPKNTPSTTPIPKTTPPTDDKKNCTKSNGTDCKTELESQNLSGYFQKNRGMLMRTFYVMVGVVGIILLYFVVKTVRLQKRKSKAKRYGLLTTSSEDRMEMTPLDQDEDDDMTLYEANGRHK